MTILLAVVDYLLDILAIENLHCCLGRTEEIRKEDTAFALNPSFSDVFY
jgi:hypothetical protein